MQIIRFFVAALAAAFFMIATPAPANTVISDDCYSRKILVDLVSKVFGQRVAGLGAADKGIFQGMLIERWQSPGGKGWTLTATFPGGRFSCILAASDDDWRNLRPPPGKPAGRPL